MPETPQTFGQHLRRRRQALEIMQIELAKRVGISGHNLNNIEYDHNYPSLPVYIRLCKELGMRKPPFAP